MTEDRKKPLLLIDMVINVLLTATVLGARLVVMLAMFALGILAAMFFTK